MIFNNMSFDLALIYRSARRIVRVYYDILICGLIPLLLIACAYRMTRIEGSIMDFHREKIAT